MQLELNNPAKPIGRSEHGILLRSSWNSWSIATTKSHCTDQVHAKHRVTNPSKMAPLGLLGVWQPSKHQWRPGERVAILPKD
jgi:hypothetical protein